MHAKVVDWPDGYIAVELAIAPDEIVPLQENLDVLRRDADQHFHLSSGRAPGRLADIEISVMSPGGEHNLSMTSVALPPGTEVRTGPRRWWIAPWRSLAAGFLWITGAAAWLSAMSCAYITYETDAFKPTLARGAWNCALAWLALYACGFFARDRRAKVAALVTALLVLIPFTEIVRRLAAF